ncbi:MAG: GGDEF domain-containing protein [bacterium]
MRHLANHDQLTGLLTRRRFEDRAQNLLSRSQHYNFPMTMIMMDLDDFKEINDQYGHASGDEVLSKTGDIIQECLREADLACWYGGEEFCVLMPETDVDAARNPADRILDTLSKTRFTTDEGTSYSITCSLGLAEQRSSGDTFEDLYQRADQALYKAKESGGNCLVVS